MEPSQRQPQGRRGPGQAALGAGEWWPSEEAALSPSWSRLQNQPARGPWLTPKHVVEAAVVVFFEQPISEESLAYRWLALCWSPWVVEDMAQYGGG